MSVSPGPRRWARPYHLATFAVTLFALVFQLWLVVIGEAVLIETEPPALSTRLIRFFSYFTIQSNLLVLVSAWTLWRNPERDGRWWRAVRLGAVVGITVTGIVAWFVLRPLLNLHGANYVADKFVHIVVPLIAVAGWVVFGPRRRITRDTVLRFLLWPLAWLGYTLIRGPMANWYPYPFLDVDAHGYGRVALNCVLVALLLVGLGFGALALDRVLDRRSAGVRAPI